MVSQILNHRITQITLFSLIILGALLCVFTPDYPLFKKGSLFAVQIMFGYLLLSMGFLALRQPKLMFTSFACCACLCLTLKYASNAALKHPERTNEVAFKVAHFNISEAENYQAGIKAILETEADLISIQELDPFWLEILETELSHTYKDHLVYQTLDFHSMAVFSKYDILSPDTFLVDGIPNLVGCIRPDEKTRRVHFISSHTTPPLYNKDFERMANQLKEIGERANQIETPIITLGDYHAPPWWNEIQDLKQLGRLIDSRRSDQSVFITPYDYIFYSDDLECINFKSISSVSSSHLGIQGEYQFSPDTNNTVLDEEVIKKDKEINVKTSQKF